MRASCLPRPLEGGEAVALQQRLGGRGAWVGEEDVGAAEGGVGDAESGQGQKGPSQGLDFGEFGHGGGRPRGRRQGGEVTLWGALSAWSGGRGRSRGGVGLTLPR
jgi:hypothetical protein